MGERVYASITVRQEDRAQFEEIAAAHGWDAFQCEEADARTVEYSDDQVNYGEFGFEAALHEHGLEFDKYYGAGPDWSEGHHYSRVEGFNDLSVDREAAIREFVSALRSPDATLDALHERYSALLPRPLVRPVGPGEGD